MSVVSLDSRRTSSAASLTATHQIVILDSLYDNIHDDQALQLFAKAARLKIQGYQGNYTFPVLPVDQTDFIATHILLCEKSATGLEPIMGYKIVTFDQCQRFKQEFPAFHVIGSQTSLPDHFTAIAAEVGQAQEGRERLGYIGSWTVRPNLDDKRTMARHCRDVSTATLVLMCRELGLTRGLTFAVRRFKVEKYHESMGLKPLEHEGKALEPFPYEAFFGELCSVSLLDTKAFSEEAKSMAVRYQDLWKERLVLRSDPAAVKKAAA